MSEPERGTSPMDELCHHLTALTQAVKNLQEGYNRLEERVQTLSTSASASSAPGVSSVAPAVVMLPPEPRVPTPERFLGDRSKFRAFRNTCELYFAYNPSRLKLPRWGMSFTFCKVNPSPGPIICLNRKIRVYRV